MNTLVNKNYFYHLDLIDFKINICPNANNYHNKKTCYNYHQYYDKRRDFKEVNYSSKLCLNSKIDCINGSKCKNSHNKIELFYHPKNYKIKYCIDFLKNGHCEFKNYCSFAHHKYELKIDILENYQFDYNFFVFKYKTEFCPILNFEHDKNKCIYAHSIQDFRRNNMMELIPKSCKNWKINNNENYENNCPDGFNCKYCHGFKEYDYHPLIFKTKPCYSGKKKCKFGAICHFYHNNDEKRDLNDFKNGLTYSCRRIILKEIRETNKRLNPKKKEFIIQKENENPNFVNNFKEKLKAKLKEKLKEKLNGLTNNDNLKSKYFKQMSTIDNIIVDNKKNLVN